MLLLTDALLTAARRHCQQQSAYWSGRYACERTGTDEPYTYTDSDYRLFPRSNVAAAILGELERLTGRAGDDLPELRARLIMIGREAESQLTQGDLPAVALDAMQAEREHFIQFIGEIGEEALAQVQPLPWRRRLSEEEREAVREALFRHWNFQGDYWNPLEALSPHPVRWAERQHLSEADAECLRSVIRRHAGSLLYEIAEDGSDTEIEPALLHLQGEEMLYCDPGYSWILYCSHEDTLTVGGGLLTDTMEQLFRDRPQLLHA